MKKIYGRVLVACAALALASCTDDFDGMNTNPYTITDGNPAYLLSHVIELTSNVSCDPYQRGENLYGQFFAHYLSNTSASFGSDRYAYNDGWAYTALWTPFYTSLKETRYVLNSILPSHPEFSNIAQMMRIVTAWRAVTVTDIYGDIPYSRAGLGDDGVPFDTQRDVYYAVFAELAEAVAALRSAPAGQAVPSADQDLLFAGNVDKWVRFANSVRLRAAMRLSYADPEKARAEGEAALAAGVMAGNDDNAAVRITATGSSSWGHPLYMISQWDGFVMTDDLYRAFTTQGAVDDPRMPMWFGETSAYRAWVEVGGRGTAPARWGSQPSGMTVAMIGEEARSVYHNSQAWGLQAYPGWNSHANTVAQGPGNSVVTLPLRVMSYAEVCLLRAEAAVRGWSGAGDARENYEAGVRASIAESRQGVAPGLYSTADDEAFLASGDMAWDDAADTEAKVRRIVTQKWVALYPDGFEGWSEFRRTGYPELTPVCQSDDANINPANGEFVKKIRYPDAERRDNPNATLGSLNNNQGDGMHVRVWWDTRSR